MRSTRPRSCHWKTRDYCIVTARLPAGASQPRVRQVSADIDAILKDVPGIKGWVTIGGYSALDSAKLSNVVTAFVMYQDWEKRPPGFSQTKILATLQEKFLSLQSAQVAVLPPSPIPGLGNAFGFQMVVEDRAGAGLGELQKTVQEILRIARNRQGFLRIGFTTFSASSPQLYLDIDRTMAKSLGVTLNDVSRTLQTYLGSTYVNLFNKFNQSFQVRVQSEADYRRQLDDIGNLYVANQSGQMVPLGSLLDVRRVLGSELITRYNLYPAATITGVPMPKFSSGEALSFMEQTAANDLAPRHGLRMDGTFLPGEAHWQSGLFYLRAVDHLGLPGARRPVRKLDRSGRGDSHRAHGARGNRHRRWRSGVFPTTCTRRSVSC